MKRITIFALIIIGIFSGCSKNESSITPDFSKVHEAAEKAFKEVE